MVLWGHGRAGRGSSRAAPGTVPPEVPVCAPEPRLWYHFPKAISDTGRFSLLSLNLSCFVSGGAGAPVLCCDSKSCAGPCSSSLQEGFGAGAVALLGVTYLLHPQEAFCCCLMMPKGLSPPRWGWLEGLAVLVFVGDCPPSLQHRGGRV